MSDPQPDPILAAIQARWPTAVSYHVWTDEHGETFYCVHHTGGRYFDNSAKTIESLVNVVASLQEAF